MKAEAPRAAALVVVLSFVSGILLLSLITVTVLLVRTERGQTTQPSSPELISQSTQVPESSMQNTVPFDASLRWKTDAGIILSMHDDLFVASAASFISYVPSVTECRNPIHQCGQLPFLEELFRSAYELEDLATEEIATLVGNSYDDVSRVYATSLLVSTLQYVQESLAFAVSERQFYMNGTRGSGTPAQSAEMHAAVQVLRTFVCTGQQPNADGSCPFYPVDTQ